MNEIKFRAKRKFPAHILFPPKGWEPTEQKMFSRQVFPVVSVKNGDSVEIVLHFPSGKIDWSRMKGRIEDEMSRM